MKKLAIFATLMLISMAYAQGTDIETSLSPVVNLLKGLINIGYKLVQYATGMDEVSNAVFMSELGIKGYVRIGGTDVPLRAINAVEGYKLSVEGGEVSSNSANYIFASYKKENGDEISGDIDSSYVLYVPKKCLDKGLVSYNSENNKWVFDSDYCRLKTLAVKESGGSKTYYFWSSSENKWVETVYAVTDIVYDVDEDGKFTKYDAFDYLLRSPDGDLLPEKLVIDENSKGQVLLFAFLIPFAMLFFLFYDFLISTGLLRHITAMAMALGITLIAARTGVYVNLLLMVNNVFNNFFVSMFSIYLMIAIVLWLYGGIRRSWAIAKAEEDVKEAVISGFQYDLLRGMISKEVAEKWANRKYGGGGQQGGQQGGG